MLRLDSIRLPLFDFFLILEIRKENPGKTKEIIPSSEVPTEKKTRYKFADILLGGLGKGGGKHLPPTRLQQKPIRQQPCPPPYYLSSHRPQRELWE